LTHRTLSTRVAIFLTFLVVAGSALAGPLNLRYPTPSPDGSKICFSYQGDLWIVSSQGGKAERLTVHVGYDAYPKWSPDGNFIAFSSQRYGNYDVYVIPATGGVESRVTYHSAEDLVSGWSPDGRRVMFTSERDRPYSQVWEVAAAGGRARPLTTIESSDGRKSADGTKLLFVRGRVPWYRTGYRGTAAAELVTKDLAAGTITRITNSTGNERDGFWSPSGSEVLYLSDSAGVYNLFKKNLVSGQTTQLTNHRTSISHLSLAQDASLAAYELAGEIFVYDLRSGLGRKLEVEAPPAEKTNSVEHVAFDSGISEFSVSPDGNLIAFIFHGDIFCRDLSGAYQQQLTSTPAVERDILWSPDSKQLAFVSDQEFTYDIYIVRSTDPNQVSLARTHDREIAPFMKSDADKRLPFISPDQGKMGFIRNGTDLVIRDIKKQTERTFSEKGTVSSLDWSPDGRYVVFTRLDNDWSANIYLCDSESGTIYKINEVKGSYIDPRFSADGRVIYYVNNYDIHYFYLERRLAEMTFPQRIEYAAKNTAKNALGLPPTMIDFEGIADRDMQLTQQQNIETVLMSPNSYTLVYITAMGQVEKINLDGSERQVLTDKISKPQRLQMSPRGETAYVQNASGRIISINVQDGSISQLAIHGETDIDRKRDLEHTFDQAWGTLKNHFYDPAMNGIDWEAVRQNYLARALAATEPTDMADIIREMTGELNCSHIQVWKSMSSSEETGWLGVVPDYEDNSGGLRVKSILPGSPAASVSSELRPEDKITAIESVKLNSGTDFNSLLSGTVGSEVKLDIFSRDGISRSVLIRPVDTEMYYDLEYRDQLARTRAVVDDLSGNRLAYIHLRQMDSQGTNEFEEELNQQLDGKKGLILDIRNNVGGNNHEEILQAISRKPYVQHRKRDGSVGWDASNPILVPIVLLVDETTTSDAEIMAQAFRELGLGTIVGTTTYGAVVGAQYFALTGSWSLSIPTVGWYTLKGEPMENHGVVPDVVITPDLTRLERDWDDQLEEAIKILVGKIK
jgi:tricorn protease